MRALALRCAPLGITIKTPTDDALKYKIPPGPRERDFEDCLYALVTVLAKDKPRNARRVAEDVGELAQKLAVPDLVVNPYAHLDDNLADTPTSLYLLDHHIATLEQFAAINNSTWRVTALPFGYQKVWRDVTVLQAWFFHC